MQVHTHATRLSLPRRIATLAALLVLTNAAMGLGGCAQRVRDIRAEHERRTQAMNETDPTAVLAGREPRVVLAHAMAGAGCIWRSKVIFTTAENHWDLNGYSYDAATRTLVTDSAYTYEKGLGVLGRGLSRAAIPLAEAKVFVSPPDPFGNVQCFEVRFHCIEKDCIHVDQRHQDVDADHGTVIEESTKEIDSFSWRLLFKDEDDAVDAFAALRALAD